MKFSSVISFPIFILSLSIGLLFVYLHDPQENIIYVYPTPDNVDQFEYKDLAKNCFSFAANKVTCPSDKNKIKNIPIQVNKKK